MIFRQGAVLESDGHHPGLFCLERPPNHHVDAQLLETKRHGLLVADRPSGSTCD
jgi:hypothetical protein